jgi:hypothetical protein
VSDASYAADVARLLWPAPWSEPRVSWGSRGRGGERRTAWVFPSARRPRLLLPADVPASATMLRRLGGGSSPAHAAARRVLERAVGSRAFALAPWPALSTAASAAGADSVETHLAEAFGTEVRVGVVLGTRRVNQKPVLQVFDRRGRLLGYAKIGHNPLTAALVRREAVALTRLHDAAPRLFEVPRVVHHGRWSGLEVLAMTALESDPARPVDPGARSAAARELTALHGTTTLPLAASGLWTRLTAEATRLGDERLARAGASLVATYGEQEVTLGSWHGDWGHWNMASGRTALQVWDWERRDEQVPAGFDELHHAAQLVRPHTAQGRAQEAALLAALPAVLAGQGVATARHRLTLCLYLLEISTRYVDALTHGATPALQRRTAWTLDLLERQLTTGGAP